MKKILLNPKEDQVVAFVDDEDYMLVNQHEWRLWIDPGGYKYAIRSANASGGLLASDRVTIYMHRYIMDMPDSLQDSVDKFGVKLYVQHLDGNGLNNCRHNLVVSTASDLSFTGKRIYPCPGVTKKGKKWVATVVHNKQRYYLGTHDTKEAAMIIRDAKALELYSRVFMLHRQELHCKLSLEDAWKKQSQMLSQPSQPEWVRQHMYPYSVINNCMLCEYVWQQHLIKDQNSYQLFCDPDHCTPNSTLYNFLTSKFTNGST